VTAFLQGVTGLALMMAPGLVVRLFAGQRRLRRAGAIGRLAGVALIALALACWPASDGQRSTAPPLRAMLIYNLVITIFLGFLGIAGHAHGRLLWPAVTIHAVVALLLARSWFHDRCNHERL